MKVSIVPIILLAKSILATDPSEEKKVVTNKSNESNARVDKRSKFSEEGSYAARESSNSSEENDNSNSTTTELSDTESSTIESEQAENPKTNENENFGLN